MPSPNLKDVFSPGSPPSDSAGTKRDLISWWKQFTRTSNRRDGGKTLEPVVPGIFGVPLQTSLRYANVAISLYDDQGKSYIYGYVPIVVAKCGVFLKEKATEIEGIFRLSGSEKRIRELRTIFDSPDKYGKGLDWAEYTVHDAANILRRYFNQLPEPIIPLEFYTKFRDPLYAHYIEQSPREIEQPQPVMHFDDQDEIIKQYQKLIVELPPLNRHLLLYILDLLAVFASKSDINKMTTSNLAAIFQPGTLFHPSHDMSPEEYRLNQFVLIFLIEKQDHFLIGMQGTAADAKTVQEVESGPPTPAWNTKPKVSLGRSASVSSVGGESLRQKASLRRNLSVSSKLSTTSSPATPTGGTIKRLSNLHKSSRPSSVVGIAISNSREDEGGPNGADEEPRESLLPAGTIPTTTVTPQTPPKSSKETLLNTDETAKRIAGVSVPVPVPSPEIAEPCGAPWGGTSPAPKSPERSRWHRQENSVRRLVSVLSQASSRDPSRQPNKLQKPRAPSVQSSDHSSTQSLTNSCQAPPTK